MSRKWRERTDILVNADEKNMNIGSNNADKFNTNESCCDENPINDQNEEQVQTETEKSGEQCSDYQEKLKKVLAECEEYKDKLQRLAAEYDNFKKRTVKEKERLYQEAVCDIVLSFIPVMDNFERAVKSNENQDYKSFRDGILMVSKQLAGVFADIGVEKIEAKNCEFDPNYHNAVLHVDDDSIGENVIIEEFQCGYKYQDKVIRHSMVKVAN